MKGNFVERTLRSFIEASEYAAAAERLARARGLLQRMDARVKVALLFGLVIAVAASRQLRLIGILFLVAIVLAVASRVSIRKLADWVWLPVLFFTGAIALPAIFIVPHGWRSAAFLVSRAETAATFSALLVLTTSWPGVLHALRAFKCPVVVVAILGMTYRYIFVILQTAFEMMESRKSRTVGTFLAGEHRRVAVASVGVLLSKSLHLSGEVHLAMQSRGFRGEVYLLDDRF